MRGKRKTSQLKVESFHDHEIISQPNPLGSALSYVEGAAADDPVARAEKALEDLSGEFKDWMDTECDRLLAAHQAVLKQGFTKTTKGELFRAAHDIKGDAATFGFPAAAAAAESLCRIIEHAPDIAKVPSQLIAHHVEAVQAIVREHARIDAVGVAGELSQSLRKLADEYLMEANQDHPERLIAIQSPSIAPQA